MFDLNAPQFRDADSARAHLEQVRWPNGPVCPHCGTVGKAWAIEGGAQKKTSKARKGLYKCGSYGCLQQFTVTVGTVFERSKVPLHKWLLVTYLMCASKKSISAKQIQRMIGVTYKTAWFMCHRVREAMRPMGFDKLGGGGSIVEADETYFGTSNKALRAKAEGKKRTGGAHKMKIFSMVERGGNVRSFHVDKVNSLTVKGHLVRNVHKDTRLMTDEAMFYRQTGKGFQSHEAVNHSEYEYVRGDVTTNTAESFFALVKRSLIGTYHHVGEQHLHRYMQEFDFRYNQRKVSDAQRADAALRGIEGKRLTYRD